MALATRPSPGFERFLAEPVEDNILTYLSVRELHAGIQVSKTWSLVTRNENLWRNALANEQDEKTRNQLDDRLFNFLITAIQEKQYDKISRWITIGAKINKRHQGTISYFQNPTVLSIAAKLLSKQEGINIIRLLLHHGADVFEASDYMAMGDPYNRGSFLPPEFETPELPSKSARDSSIKVLLHLVEFEIKLSCPDYIDHQTILYRLENANEADEIATQEYVNSLILQKEAKASFQGIQQELKLTDQEKLTDEQYRAFSEISFFQQYRQSLAAAAYCSLEACTFKSTIELGAIFIGLFTSAAVPPAIALIFGAAIVGLISGIAYTLVKKAWDHYHHVEIINPPPPTQQPKILHGGLFFKPKPSDEQKENKMEVRRDPAIFSPSSSAV